MKKLIFLLLLIPSLVWGAADDVKSINGVAVGSVKNSIEVLGSTVKTMCGKTYADGDSGTTAYCTGAATCTATNPGECDQICEDMEGTAACHTSGEENCRNTWTENVDTGGAINWAATASGTYPCAGTTNTKVLQITNGDAYSNTYVSKAYSTQAGYLQFYVNFVSGTLGNSDYAGLGGFFGSGYGNWIASVLFYRTAGGVLKMRAQYVNSSYADVFTADSTTTLSQNTWYRIRMYWKQSTGDLEVYIGDTKEWDLTDACSDCNYSDQLRFSTSTAGTSIIMQFDNKALDDDTLPGACN